MNGEPPSRVAVVTGGAGGIGSAVVVALATQGHHVVIADINYEGGVEVAERTGSLALDVDVTDTDSVEAAMSRVERELGPVEILVNNAGWDEMHAFLKTDEAFWDRVIEVNFKGALRTCRRVVPGMVEGGYGRIVNVGSDAARVGSSFEAVYSGAKGGLVAFTKTLAREVARHGLTANAVCPGPTDTPMLEQMLTAGAGSANVIESLRRAIPMRRLGQPADVAAAVAFLASDDAGFITGQTLSVSGGLTMA